MATRREFVASTALSAAALALAPLAACSREVASPAASPQAPAATAETPPTAATPTAFAGTLLARPVPASGEPLPVIGMGTSGSFEVGTGDAERDPLREVLRRFLAAGATVVDTAPTYGSAEDVLGDLLAEAGARERIFLATKLSGVSGREAGLAQFGDSLRRLRTDRVELLQVHNLRDTETQLALARELKQQGKVKYVGLTHFVERAHDDMADAMRRHRPDFVQINYSPLSRGAEKRIFPLARDLGIAVIVNRAFEDGRLFARVEGRPLPAWAADVDAGSWAQLFLKFAISEPAVTVVIPATAKPDNETDNLKAGVGRLPDAAQRDALAQLLA